MAIFKRISLTKRETRQSRLCIFMEYIILRGVLSSTLEEFVYFKMKSNFAFVSLLNNHAEVRCQFTQECAVIRGNFDV